VPERMVEPKSKLNQEHGVSVHNNPVPDTRHHHYEKTKQYLQKCITYLPLRKGGLVTWAWRKLNNISPAATNAWNDLTSEAKL